MTDDRNVPENEEKPEIFAVSREENSFKIDRRAFLGASGVVAAGAALTAASGAANADANIAATRTPRPTRTPAVSPTPGAPCTVRTSEQGIYVYVGPGRHRGIRAFMPVNEDVPVIGKGKDPNDVYWWQIELPDIDQAWVDPEDVEVDGDCEAVIDVDAPPFVPEKPRATAAPTGTAAPTALPGVPGQVQPGQTGINYRAPDGTIYTLPCGSAIPPGMVCVCNCVTVPAPCSCDGYCSCAGASHYWYPN